MKLKALTISAALCLAAFLGAQSAQGGQGSQTQGRDRQWAGIDQSLMKSLQKLLGQNPATVRTVDPKGPAAAAGLKADDIITGIDGKELDKSLAEAIKALKPGTTVKLTVLRELREYMELGYLPKAKTFSVKLGEKAGKAWLGIEVQQSAAFLPGMPVGTGRGGLGRQGGNRDQADPLPSGQPPRQGQLAEPGQGGKLPAGSPPPGAGRQGQDGFRPMPSVEIISI
jgi:membrane-associated protease RseP (regulator of RpoE activity)